MTEHLSSDQLDAYRRAALDPVGLLAADDHLASCPPCRARLLPVHLSYEQLESHAEGRLKDPSAQTHLETCARCLAEAEDLRAFVLARAAGQNEKRTRGFWWFALPAAAVAAMALATIFITRQPVPEPVRMASAAQPAAALPPELAALKQDALRTGTVEAPAAIRDLWSSGDVLRGKSEPTDPVVLTGPVNTATLTPAPTLRWQAIPGAAWYQVSVFDSKFEPKATSGRLTANEWTPSRPLAPGQVYVWQVTAFVHGESVTGPRPPNPEARFLVLPDPESARLRAIAARYPNDHLLLAVLYAKAGASEAARAELCLTDAQVRLP